MSKNYEEKTITVHKNIESLYAAHEKIYPREVKGKFNTLRVAAVWWLLGMYYLVAWISWDGRQAVLFDLPARKFYIFGFTFWPQDFIYLAWLLIIAALSLFFFTAVAGRLWCGYACPQTVWTEAFIWMERLVEGGRKDQLRLKKSAWNKNKITKTATKQFLWVTFALWTGFTFVGYFTPIKELGQEIFTWSMGPWEIFWVFFYSLATYGNAGFLREQVCLYMCPYARFQSSMIDKDTMIITYDKNRGEPRLKGRARKEAGDSAGSCIDCDMCVQVCPTGIDIRDGLQYECIGCAACIDVCNEVMDRQKQPRHLIRYTTENILKHEDGKIIRPRILIYGTILLSLLIGFAVSVTMRTPLALDILRDRNALYKVVDEQHVENIYTLRIMNKSNVPQRYKISASGIEGLTVEETISQEIQPGSIGNTTLHLIAPVQKLKHRSNPIMIKLETYKKEDAHQIQEESRFFGPKSR